MSDDAKQSDITREELAAWQQAGEEQAKARYGQVREHLERLTTHLASMRDELQIERLLAEQKEMNEAHDIVQGPPRPRWLPAFLHRSLTRLIGAFVVPHLRETEQRQKQFNIYATKTINELSHKVLHSEKILLEHQAQLAKLLAALLTALEMKIDAVSPAAAHQPSPRPIDEAPPELRQLENELARMNQLLEQLKLSGAQDASPVNDSADDAPPQSGAHS